MSRRLRVVLAAAGAAILLAIAWVALVPWYARRRIVAEAAARGVTLAVGEVSVSLREVAITGVSATARDVPGVTVGVGRIDVHLRGFFVPTSIEASNASIEIDGRAGDVSRAIERFSKSQPRGEGEEELESISLQNTRIEWRRALGEGTVLRVGDLGGEVRGSPLGSDSRIHLANVTIDIGAVSIGPWSGSLTRDQTRSQASLVLSPKGADVAAITLVRSAESEALSMEVKIPNAVSLAELGIPKPLLQLYEVENATVAIDMTHTEDDTKGSGAVRKLHVEGVRLAGAPIAASLDLADLSYGGPLEGMTITGGRIRVGPLSGRVEGTIGRPSGGVTLDAKTTTDVMSCADLLRMPSSLVLGPSIVKGIDDLSRALGMTDPVKGTVSAYVQWRADSRDLRSAKLTVLPQASCELAFLPRRAGGI